MQVCLPRPQSSTGPVQPRLRPLPLPNDSSKPNDTENAAKHHASAAGAAATTPAADDVDGNDHDDDQHGAAHTENIPKITERQQHAGYSTQECRRRLLQHHSQDSGQAEKREQQVHADVTSQDEARLDAQVWDSAHL